MSSLWFHKSPQIRAKILPSVKLLELCFGCERLLKIIYIYKYWIIFWPELSIKMAMRDYAADKGIFWRKCFKFSRMQQIAVYTIYLFQSLSRTSLLIFAKLMMKEIRISSMLSNWRDSHTGSRYYLFEKHHNLYFCYCNMIYLLIDLYWILVYFRLLLLWN